MKKLLIIGIVFLTLITSTFSVLTDAEAYYSFDEDTITGSEMEDLSGNGFNQTCFMTSNCDTVEGLLINASDFDGSSDRMNVSSPFTHSDYITIAFWFNYDTNSGGNSILYKGNGFSSSEINYYVDLDSNNLRFRVNTGSGLTGLLNVATGLNANTWHYATITYDGTRVVAYINATETYNSTSGVSGSITNIVGGLEIGSRENSNFFDGKADELGIWDKSLNNSDIQELYNSGNGFNPYSTLTPQIETNLTEFYSLNNISIQLNTTLNVNMSYILDLENETIICSDCNNSILNLSSLTDGEHTINFISKNSDGNNTNIQTFEINPFQYFRFNNSVSSSFVEDYTFGGYSSNGTYVSIPFNDLNVGNNTLTFTKAGFIQENFTFFVNISNRLNETFNITPTTLSLTVFDEFSPSTQIPFNVTIINNTNSTIYLNQVNFSINYNESLKGNLTLVIESEGYLSRNFFTTLSPISSISQVIYLIPIADADQVIFRTINSLDSQPVSDSILNFYRYINGTKTFLGQAETDGNGFTSFNLDSTKIYEVLLTSDGFITQIFNTLPNTLTYTIILNPEGILINWLFEDFSYKFIPTTNIIDSFPVNLSVIYVDDDNLITNAIFTVESDSYTYSTSSTSPSGTTLNLLIDNTSSTYQATLTVLREGETYTFSKIYNYYNESDYNTTIINLSETLDDESNDSDRVLIIIVGIVIFASIGAWLGGAIGGAIALFIPLILFAYIEWLPIGLSILLMAFIVLGVLVFQR